MPACGAGVFEQLRYRRIVEPKELPRRAEQPFPFLSEAERAGRSREYGASQLVLQAFDLQADGRLGAAQAVAGAGEAAGFGNGDEAPQQVEVESSGSGHGGRFSAYHLVCQ